VRALLLPSRLAAQHPRLIGSWQAAARGLRGLSAAGRLLVGEMGVKALYSVHLQLLLGGAWGAAEATGRTPVPMPLPLMPMELGRQIMRASVYAGEEAYRRLMPTGVR